MGESSGLSCNIFYLPLYENIRHRAEVFRRESNIRKAVQTVLVAANGVAKGKYLGNIQHTVDGNALFAS